MPQMLFRKKRKSSFLVNPANCDTFFRRISTIRLNPGCLSNVKNCSVHDQSRKRSLTQHHGKMAQAPCWVGSQPAFLCAIRPPYGAVGPGAFTRRAGQPTGPEGEAPTRRPDGGRAP